MTPEAYKRWRLGLGFVTAKELAEHLNMAAISISTYESRGSGSSADDKLLRILEKKILDRSDDFINSVIDTAVRFGQIPSEARNAILAERNDTPVVSESSQLEIKQLEDRVRKLETAVAALTKAKADEL